MHTGLFTDEKKHACAHTSNTHKNTKTLFFEIMVRELCLYLFLSLTGATYWLDRKEVLDSLTVSQLKLLTVKGFRHSSKPLCFVVLNRQIDQWAISEKSMKNVVFTNILKL